MAARRTLRWTWWQRHTCGVTGRFTVDVERFAMSRHPAVEIPLDGRGMLAAGSGLILGTGLVAVSDLVEKGSFCLLGEPGAGKTTALRSVVRDIPEIDQASPG